MKQHIWQLERKIPVENGYWWKILCTMPTRKRAIDLKNKLGDGSWTNTVRVHHFVSVK